MILLSSVKPKPDKPEPNRGYDCSLTAYGEIHHGNGDIGRALRDESA